jgi:hypothetical protein
MTVRATPRQRVRVRVTVDGGRCVPGILPRVAVVILSLAAFALLPTPYSYVAIALAVIGALLPPTLATWGCLLVIGLGQLARPADAGDWHLYAALAVVHLLHVVGALSMVIDPRGMLQLRALRRPLARWAMIQVPAQAVLAMALLVREFAVAGSVLLGAFAIVGAVSAAAAIVLLMVLSPRR